MRLVVPLLVVFAVMPAASYAQFFPYPIQKKTLPNGLDVVVIETPEFKDVLSFNVLILAGSGRENEKGRSGLAHLFEHIIFRHDHDTPQAYQPAVEKLGAFNNAYTWFDVTYYHPLTFTSNLEKLAALEASRFMDLRYSERVFRTEAGAVHGEYRRIASDPALRIEEVLSDLMYGTAHGYGHTAIGYLDDVKDMPNAYKSAVAFYRAYYRPNNAIVVVSGDVKADEVFRVVEKYFGGWQRANIPQQPDPGPIKGPKRQDLTWPSEVPPRVVVGYKVPAFVPGSAEGAVILVMAELMGGETAPLYRRLRYDEQLATDITVDRTSAIGFDDRPLTTDATISTDKYAQQGRAVIERVAGDISSSFEGLSNFSSQPEAGKRLESIKSQMRFDMLASFNSPANIAENFVLYYRFTRDPQVMDKVADSIARLRPADVEAFARKYFTPQNRVTVTVTPAGGAK